jgi:L-iditol 2-dehydrogenase
MKAIIWDGGDYPKSLSYKDFKDPTPSPGWAIVRTMAAGICGSDKELILGHTRYMVPDRNLPAILGHENAGIVVEVGQGVKRVKPGDRVAVEPIHGCIEFGGSCRMCRIGKYQLCESGLTIVGLPYTKIIHGGFGEYSQVHETRLFPIPDHLSYEEAAMLDVLGCGIHASGIGDPALGKTAVVMGCGVIGLDLIQCLKAKGITDIIAVAKHEFQADCAKRLGARDTVLIGKGIDPVKEVMRLTAAWGVDIAYECVGGQTDTVDECVAMCGFNGNVVVLGGASTPRPIDIQILLRREAHILTSNCYSTAGSRREFEIGLKLLSEGRVDHKTLITHRYSPEDYKQAFEVAVQKGQHSALKTVFVRS